MENVKEMLERYDGIKVRKMMHDIIFIMKSFNNEKKWEKFYMDNLDNIVDPYRNLNAKEVIAEMEKILPEINKKGDESFYNVLISLRKNKKNKHKDEYDEHLLNVMTTCTLVEFYKCAIAKEVLSEPENLRKVVGPDNVEKVDKDVLEVLAVHMMNIYELLNNPEELSKDEAAMDNIASLYKAMPEVFNNIVTLLHELDLSQNEVEVVKISKDELKEKIAEAEEANKERMWN